MIKFFNPFHLFMKLIILYIQNPFSYFITINSNFITMITPLQVTLIFMK